MPTEAELLRRPDSSERPAASGHPSNWRLGFWGLIATQFETGFNDNGLKFLVTYLVIGMNLAQAERDRLVPIVGLMFALPFILFSMTGGYFADRYSKRSATIGTKLFEIGVMFFFILALALHSLPLECAGVFLISVEGAVFGPSKYGLLPELLPEHKLSWGNGIIEFGTFLAAIAGQVAAGGLAQRYQGREAVAGLVLLGFSCIGLLTSLAISRVPAADPQRKFHWNPIGDLWRELKRIRQDRVLAWAVLDNTYLFFLAALLQTVILIYSHDVLRIDDVHTTYLTAALAIGIGVGSLAAGYLSGGKIEYGLIPLGAIGMTVFAAFMYQPSHSLTAVGIHLALLGFFGGIFAVPLGALIQHRPRPEEKGGVIAAANLVSFVGIGVASGAYYLFADIFHQTARGMFLDGAALTLVATAYSIYLLPDSLLRFVLWMLTHSLYRIRVEGRDNIPETGGALFVVNHMSLVDACLLIASTDRPIRFLMFKGIYDLPYIKPFAKMIRAIPISSELRPREMLQSLREATNSIRAGEVVCIFAEGQITRIGQMLPFRRGMERIMKGVDAPIVPVNLDGVWGSIFSFERGRFLWKIPRRIPYPVTVSFGTPMPPTSSALTVRAAVQELQAEAFRERKHRMRTLDRAFVRTARRFPLRFMMADGKTPRVSFFSALTKTIFIARRLRPAIGDRQMIGLLLPPSVGGALTNYALTLLGRVPVNLNYTASSEVIASCAKQCDVDVVITSKAFVERFPKLEIPGRTIFLEDVLQSPRATEKLLALLLASTAPQTLLRKVIGAIPATRGIDDLATVIFSSGSTGDPKGVMLTHYNIGSNIQQVSQVFMLGGRDKILGILPFFHSFGFMAALWMPAANGIGVVFHPNPLDTKVIGELVGQYRVTFLIATPTFLQAYMRRCSPESFGSLQYVLVGAEKLADRVAMAFEDTFGIRPLEGYGCTECSPVVTVNGRDFRAPGFRQVGARRGKIGHPLPGVSVRVVDLDTGAPVAPGTAGMLLVKGPNVMKGYLGKPEKTAEVLRDGWYTTGDVALMEEDGFLTITDRLSRFSKIGGEMVPHIKIEDKLHELAGVTEQVFAVTSLPDEKKGERIVVISTLSTEKLAPVIEKFAQCDLPALWKPRAAAFFHVDALPILGTGKIDLRGVKALAATMA